MRLGTGRGESGGACLGVVPGRDGCDVWVPAAVVGALFLRCPGQAGLSLGTPLMWDVIIYQIFVFAWIKGFAKLYPE